MLLQAVKGLEIVKTGLLGSEVSSSTGHEAVLSALDYIEVDIHKASMQVSGCSHLVIYNFAPAVKGCTPAMLYSYDLLPWHEKIG